MGTARAVPSNGELILGGGQMVAIPVYFLHEEDFVWVPGILDSEDTVEQAAQKLAQHVIGLRVQERPGKRVGITLLEDSASEGTLLDPHRKVGETIEPLSVLKLVWI
jgi:hypothetical protein